ncbi:MAG: CBS domain-containing protein, partial [Kiritimatiellae bacterium]|nr:CBS domain-containing protein [Kiritimatiellia bacterium]
AALSDPASALLARLLDGDADRLFVVDSDNRFLGIVSLADVRRLARSPRALSAVLLAEDLLRRDVPLVVPDESLSSVLAKFAASSLPELPLVRSADTPVLLGTLREPDVLAAYQAEILKADSPAALAISRSQPPSDPVPIAPGFAIAERAAPSDWLAIPFSDLPPSPVRVLLVKRAPPGLQPTVFAPTPTTVLSDHDRLVVLAPSPLLPSFLDAP